MVSASEPSVRTFFETFERTNAAGDAEGLARLYAASFLAAGPNGVHVVKASDLVAAILKRKQILETLGWRSTKLASLHETQLDDRYSMVRTEWRWRLEPLHNSPLEVTLPSTVIIERSAQGMQIVLYLNHQDIMAVLRERGLLPKG